jgi:hypothetical protein
MGLLVPFWKGVLLDDNVLWVVLPLIVAGFYLILEALWFQWQSGFACLSPLKASQCFLWSFMERFLVFKVSLCFMQSAT